MSQFELKTRLSAHMPAVCRLGLASRGNTHLAARSVRWAIDEGVNYLNWCGHIDGLGLAIGELGDTERENVVVAVQFSARQADEATQELEAILRELRTTYIDVLTFYYVESMTEWEQIIDQDGAMKAVMRARQEGSVRLVGLTTHQRGLAARVAASGLIDLLMIRYNAAHRGAERDIFPTTRLRQMPVVAFTCLRWNTLMKPTPDDPRKYVPARPPDWYRFVLANPDVSVALMAPNNQDELVENLRLLDDWRPPTSKEMAMLKAHGDRVHRHAGAFP